MEGGLLLQVQRKGSYDLTIKMIWRGNLLFLPGNSVKTTISQILQSFVALVAKAIIHHRLTVTIVAISLWNQLQLKIFHLFNKHFCYFCDAVKQVVVLLSFQGVWNIYISRCCRDHVPVTVVRGRALLLFTGCMLTLALTL